MPAHPQTSSELATQKFKLTHYRLGELILTQCVKKTGPPTKQPVM
jgi:hypothetical protein